MHSYEERMKAVQLFIKYDLSVADTIRELGYPTRNTLIRWYNEERIKISLDAMSPIEYRRSLGLAA